MCFALAFVLYVGLRNEVAPAGLARPLLVAVVVALALTGIGWAVFRNRSDGGLAASVLILVTVSLYPVLYVWDGLRDILGIAAAAAIFTAAVFVMLAGPALLALRAWRGTSPFPKPSSRTLNLLGLVVVGTVVALNGATYPSLLWNGPSTTGPAPPVGGEARPDIIVLILDAYPRQDVLAQTFDYDNAPFIRELERRGFHVQDESHSNYMFTAPSLVSMFEMRYLDGIPSIAPHIGEGGPHHAVMYSALNDGQAFDILRRAGYQVVVSANGHEHVAPRDVADEYLDHGHLADFEAGLLSRTWFLDAIGIIVPNLLIESVRNRVVDQFADLERLATAERDRPVFAFVHVPVPHLPLALDADGNAYPLASRDYDAPTPEAMGLTVDAFNQAIADEITYLNRRTLQAVDAHLSGERQPVFVVMSDHGWTFENGNEADRLANLMATYTPGAPGLLADATPANLMAIVINEYLDADIPVVENRYFRSPTNPFDFLQLIEVAGPEHPVP